MVSFHQDISLAVNGKRLDQWSGVSVSRSLGSLADSFELEYIDTITRMDYPIKTGDKCSLYVGPNHVMTGWVDVTRWGYAAGSKGAASTHNFSVSGRSRTADLFDASVLPGPSTWKNKTILLIATEICKPFGIPVTLSANIDSLVTTPIERHSVEMGESAAECLGRLARKVGVLLRPTVVGGLEIGRPPKIQAGSGLRLGPAGVAGGSRVSDHRARHDQYIAVGQRQGSDTLFGEAARAGRQSAKDPRVQRYRPIIFVSDGSSNTGTLQRSAQWMRNTRAGQSERVSYTVRGWEHSPGQPWAPGLTVFIDDKFLRLRNIGLIVESVRYTFRGGEGSRTQLDLVQPEAFQDLTDPTPPKVTDGVMTW